MDGLIYFSPDINSSQVRKLIFGNKRLEINKEGLVSTRAYEIMSEIFYCLQVFLLESDSDYKTD